MGPIVGNLPCGIKTPHPGHTHRGMATADESVVWCEGVPYEDVRCARTYPHPAHVLPEGGARCPGVEGPAITNDDGFAVWFVGSGYGGAGVDYETGATEVEAADLAVAREDSDEGGEILGLQTATGYLVPAHMWRELDAARARYRDRQNRAIDYFPPAHRTKMDPFTHSSIEVDLTEPAWLGEELP